MTFYRWAKLAPVGVETFLVPGDGTLTKVYTKINYEMMASDGVNAVWTDGTVYLGTPNPNTFVPADQVTPQQLATWLEAALGQMVGIIKTNLQAELQAAAGTTIFTGATVSNAVQQ